MSLWKYSFELTTKELEITRKKKQALDSLYESNRISQSTYDHLHSELKKAISELEGHLKKLIDKMTYRSQELEKQISTLELFLASLEIHYAAGDVSEETYEKQNNAIILGLEATKHEQDDIIDSSKRTQVKPIETSVTRMEPIEPISEIEEIEEHVNLVEEEEVLYDENKDQNSVISSGLNDEMLEEQSSQGPLEEQNDSPTSYVEDSSSQSSQGLETPVESYEY